MSINPENMKELIDDFMQQVSLNLENKFEILWPSRKNILPHENNISLSISEIAAQKEIYSYAECNMNNMGARRDLILINRKDKWVCQVEVKSSHNWDNYEEDFWRISQYNDFNNFLESEHRQSHHPLKEFKKYGLFVACGYDPLKNWWETSSNHNWIQGWFNIKDESKGITAYKNSITGRFVSLVYYIIEVTEDSKEDFLSQF
jgi:hypothetical protein